MKDLKCLQCGHSWLARVKLPKECPSCKRRNWNREDKKRAEADDNTKSAKTSFDWRKQ